MHKTNSTCHSQSRCESNFLGLPVNINWTERYASIGVGVVLAAGGLIRGQATGWLAALGGAAFLYRGLTGHCHGYAALGVSTAESTDPEPVSRTLESSQLPENVQRAAHHSPSNPRPYWLTPEIET